MRLAGVELDPGRLAIFGILLLLAAASIFVVIARVRATSRFRAFAESAGLRFIETPPERVARELARFASEDETLTASRVVEVAGGGSPVYALHVERAKPRWNGSGVVAEQSAGCLAFWPRPSVARPLGVRITPRPASLLASLAAAGELDGVPSQVRERYVVGGLGTAHATARSEAASEPTSADDATRGGVPDADAAVPPALAETLLALWQSDRPAHEQVFSSAALIEGAVLVERYDAGADPNALRDLVEACDAISRAWRR